MWRWNTNDSNALTLTRLKETGPEFTRRRSMALTAYTRQGSLFASQLGEIESFDADHTEGLREL